MDELLDKALVRLNNAVSKGRSTAYCHRLWSRFVRTRDLQRCVVCHCSDRISAHHILRKSFLSAARFESGNGITLCLSCHKKIHSTFNGRPDLQQPMDAECGENIEQTVELLGHLAADAFERGVLSDKYYFLSDKYIEICKKFQGIEEEVQFPGTRLEQVYWIWRQTPRGMLKALLSANGFELPSEFAQLGPIVWM
ncbi:conserved hypothetical protein [Dickeya chrysanthemi Ech1591]|uniref:HNH endonuclease n=1 Tax=Dickeya chrysanthemi (strain Ech1591) TaxID=561229 RepID=C6CQX9_DICC1|nr:HNH endonuclease [Dickeya chrysanthemi]ACT08996.1 conserved hypothetical protein [Dickeya chrysanthemi Ech1591]WJM85721.1 HNH endonuclease [Dickeya chrysanthemi]